MTSTKGRSKRTLVRFQNEQKRFRLSEFHILRLTRKILSLLKLKAELHLTFVSDSKIRRINKRYHHVNRVTDVLAFGNPIDWPSRKNTRRFLGEVVISIDRTIANAKQFQTGRDEELMRYVAHGILHLLGERDSKPADRKRMFAKREKLIQKIKPIRLLIH